MGTIDELTVEKLMAEIEAEGATLADLVGTAIPAPAVVEPTVEQRKKARLVKVWAKVMSREGNLVRVAFVRDARKGIQMVKDMRALGVQCGYDTDFTGHRMSTKPMVRLLYAVLLSMGYKDPDKQAVTA